MKLDSAKWRLRLPSRHGPPGAPSNTSWPGAPSNAHMPTGSAFQVPTRHNPPPLLIAYPESHVHSKHPLRCIICVSHRLGPPLEAAGHFTPPPLVSSGVSQTRIRASRLSAQHRPLWLCRLNGAFTGDGPLRSYSTPRDPPASPSAARIGRCGAHLKKGNPQSQFHASPPPASRATSTPSPRAVVVVSSRCGD